MVISGVLGVFILLARYRLNVYFTWRKTQVSYRQLAYCNTQLLTSHEVQQIMPPRSPSKNEAMQRLTFPEPPAPGVPGIRFVGDEAFFRVRFSASRRLVLSWRSSKASVMNLFSCSSLLLVPCRINICQKKEVGMTINTLKRRMHLFSLLPVPRRTNMFLKGCGREDQHVTRKVTSWAQ